MENFIFCAVNFSFCVAIISKFSLSSLNVSSSISVLFLCSSCVLHHLCNKCSFISASWSNRSHVSLAIFKFSYKFTNLFFSSCFFVFQSEDICLSSSILLFQLLKFLQSKDKFRSRTIAKIDIPNGQSNRCITKGWRVPLVRYPLVLMFLYFTIRHQSHKLFWQNN